MRRSILWFRNDLRIHDNEALVDALNHNNEIIPLYIIDPRTFEGMSPFGFPKMSAFRKNFIYECLRDLRDNIQKLGSNLYVRIGIPEVVIPELARELRTSNVYCNRERTQEEVEVQDQLESNLWSIGQEIRYYRGKMLYYTADLPFPITHCPDNFTAFRKEVEKFVKIRAAIPSPSTIDPLSLSLDQGEIPNNIVVEEEPCSNSFKLKGGETQGLNELKYYVWDSNKISEYFETRNGLLGRDYSSKFSPYLAIGALSPKKIYAEVASYESQVVKNKSTYWIIFELLWRDFFRFMAKKHGNKIFYKSGIQSKLDLQLFDNKTLFAKWQNGETGIPFVDANMRELNATGFMSNRGRQNVASFLVKDMQINWLWGAAYFESKLIDYDPCSNYGNWNYIAGVGSDPREDRYFNIPAQVKKYDPTCRYIKTWIPELKEAPIDYLINPFSNLDYIQSAEIKYPQPCVNIKNWKS